MAGTGRDDSVQCLVSDFLKSYLTRRGFLAKVGALGISVAAATGLLGAPTVARRAAAQDSSPEVTSRQWGQGTGWGWRWGTTTRWAALTDLEDLASDETYKFAYILGVNKIKGATAGTVLRPIGMI